MFISRSDRANMTVGFSSNASKSITIIRINHRLSFGTSFAILLEASQSDGAEHWYLRELSDYTLCACASLVPRPQPHEK